MKYKNLSAYLLLLISLCLFINKQLVAQQNYAKLQGFWQGKLKLLTKDSLSLLFVISVENDTLIGELDSPDQFVTNIPIDYFFYENDSIFLKASSISATFSGVYDEEKDEIFGYFIQNRVKRSLRLKKTENRLLFPRPQTPQAPYPYFVEDIIIKNPHTQVPWIMGTLTLPETPPQALLILISGSGWQDRDETIFGHKPFKVIADYLTRENYAVFRYDDLPPYFFNQATTKDFVDAVALIVDSLSIDERLKTIPIGLLGHSEGGLVALMLGANDERIDFIITLGGMVDGLKNTLLYQLEAISSKDTNLTAEELKASLVISEKVYSAIEKTKSPPKALKKCKKILEKYDSQFTDLEKEKLGLAIENRVAVLQMIASPWFFYLFHQQPKKYVKKINSPLYALYGEKDLQVNYYTNIALLKRYLPKNRFHKLESFPSLNHLLQESNTGLPQEYGKIEQTIAPKVLESIKKWLFTLNFK